jgi:hypothetical protein
MGKMEKRERLDLFFERLSAADQAADDVEAFLLISRILNEVEDEYSGVPFDPENWKDDGRLYPPLKDNARPVNGRPDLTRYRSRNHNTFIRENGAIAIRALGGDVIFEKAGKDGVPIGNLP